jgi:uncharacterized protein YjcR
MDSDALIELALKKLGCTQQALAKRLGVSPTQVSKWKSNGTEHMSFEMEKGSRRSLASMRARTPDSSAALEGCRRPRNGNGSSTISRNSQTRVRRQGA